MSGNQPSQPVVSFDTISSTQAPPAGLYSELDILMKKLSGQELEAKIKNESDLKKFDALIADNTRLLEAIHERKKREEKREKDTTSSGMLLWGILIYLI